MVKATRHFSLILLLAGLVIACTSEVNYRYSVRRDGTFTQKVRPESSTKFYQFQIPVDMLTGIRSQCQGRYEPWGSKAVCTAGLQDESTYLVAVEDLQEPLNNPYIDHTTLPAELKRLHDLSARKAFDEIGEEYLKNLPVKKTKSHSFKQNGKEMHFTGFMKTENILKQGIETPVHHILLACSFFDDDHQIFFSYYTNDKIHSMNFQKMLEGDLPTNVTSLINSFKLYN